MTIVEGIGDEVIHILIGLVVVALSILAWWSTHIREVALYRTIVIVERHNSRHSNNNNTTSVPDHNNQIVEPLGGLEVTRAVQTTVYSAEGVTETSESSSSNTATPLSSEDNQDQVPCPIPSSNEASDLPSISPYYASASLPSQSERPRERPLLVGDYVNPNLQQPSHPISSEATAQSEENATFSSPPECPSQAQSEDSVASDEHDNTIKIRLKYLNDEEKIVDGKLSELLGDFKKRHFRNELTSNKVVRLIYNGHILQQDDSTLQTCGIFNNCVIHCLVHPRRNNSNTNEPSRRYNTNSTGVNTASNIGTTNATTNTNDDWGDLGGIFYALITIILCSAWYWRFHHSHLFSFTATAALTSITAIFSIFVFSITFFHNDEIPIEII